MLDETKRRGKSDLDFLINLEVDEKKTTDVSSAYVRDNYNYIKKSHKTLLIFRRFKKGSNTLELRH